MSALRRAFTHGSLYTLFQALGMAVSLVSFPIITRILTVEEYGHLALFNATVSILLGLAKCGMTTSFIRTYAAADTVDERRRLYSSAFGASLSAALVIAGVYTVALFFLDERIGGGLTAILMLAGIPILIGSLRDLSYAFLRAEERVFALSATGLLIRIGSIASGIFACVVLLGGLKGFVAGLIGFEAGCVLLLVLTFARRGMFRSADISPNVIRQLVLFGAPLLLFEMSSLINDYADRFLINYFLGPAQVGIYSVGYNFAGYVQGLVTSPLWMAIFPIYTKIFETEGREPTARFLQTILKLYLAAAVLIVVVVSLTSHEIIVLLASRKFEAAAAVVPFVIVSIMLYGTTHLTAAGFYLTKSTRMIAVLTLGCAAAKILLNLFLIPYFGIIGAAYATVLSYVALTILVTRFSRDLLAVAWPFRDFALCLVAGAAAAAATLPLAHPHLAVSLLLKATAATVCYALCLLLLNRGLRETLTGEARRWYRQLRPAVKDSRRAP